MKDKILIKIKNKFKNGRNRAILNPKDKGNEHYKRTKMDIIQK